MAEIRLYNEQLNWMAVTDQLTQMYNRRYLERLPEETAWRGQTLAAGLMVDIDFFKQYNDTYGHVAGDSCLKSIADDIQVFIRDKNACAVRYGGEEFFICLFQCEAREAWAEAEKLRQSIQDSGFRRDDVPLGCVTVSIGVSVLENWQTDMELLIRRAGRGLVCRQKQRAQPRDGIRGIDTSPRTGIRKGQRGKPTLAFAVFIRLSPAAHTRRGRLRRPCRRPCHRTRPGRCPTRWW